MLDDEHTGTDGMVPVRVRRSICFRPWMRRSWNRQGRTAWFGPGW